MEMEVQSRFINFEEGWSHMENGITKLQRILEGEAEPHIDSKEYTSLYTIVYNMCVQKPPHDYSQQLYQKYGRAIEDYCKETVLPSLRTKHDENVLQELVRRWSNHKVLVRWLSRCFSYIDRYYVARRSLPTLNDIGLTCFRNLVYNEMKFKATEAVLTLIHKEREGEQIDRALLKNVLEMYVEMGNYVEDFESFMLQHTGAYYSHKASSWIQDDSFSVYMLKAEECLKKERERVTHYLHPSTDPKLVMALKEVFEFFGSKAERPSTEDLIERMKI